MTTLSSHELVPATVARRLARQYAGIDHAAAAAAKRPALTEAGQALAGTSASGKIDEHAAMADCCALIDYQAAHGDPGPGPESRDVVPWSYRTHRGKPPCPVCGGSGVRCCEFGADR